MTTWRKYNGALIPDQPPHIRINDSNNLIKKKIRSNNAYFARWTTDFDCNEETNFWYVICDEFISIDKLSRNTRNQIRRGLRKCDVRIVDKRIIIEEGFESYYAAFLNYSTHIKPKNKAEFQDELLAFDSEWEFWGIYNEEKMIGYCQNKIVGKYCDYSTIKFHPNYLKLYPSYALFYTMNKYYLDEKGFDYVNDGARSISHETNIQEFLIKKFKFRKAYCKLNVIYNLRIGFLVKLLYSFRLVLKLLNFEPFTKLNILLDQEKIRRSYV
jgi:hypothetical protein